MGQEIKQEMNIQPGERIVWIDSAFLDQCGGTVEEVRDDVVIVLSGEKHLKFAISKIVRSRLSKTLVFADGEMGERELIDEE